MIRALAVALAITLAGATPATAQQGAELLRALRAGGYVIFFRHTDTDWKQQDQRPIRLDDCSTQRNLSAKGRDNARAIGAAIRALAIPIGPVLASPLCRTVETAELAFGAAEKSEAVRETGRVPPGDTQRYAALRALVSTAPPAGTNTVIVGHGYPFYTLVGGQYLEEGQAAIVRPGANGFEQVARIYVAEWMALERR